MDRGNGDGYRVASDWDLEGQRHNRRVFRSRLRENRAVAVCLALLFVVLGVLVCLVGNPERLAQMWAVAVLAWMAAAYVLILSFAKEKPSDAKRTRCN